MKLVLLAVYDVVAGAYNAPPIGAPTRGVGERSFSDEVNRPESAFGLHPDDYELHEVGSFDMVTGLVEPLLPRPNVYGRARNYLKGGVS